MKQFDVTIRAVITKTLRVEAEDGDAACEAAHQAFTVECDGDEDYQQDWLTWNEVNNDEGETA